MNRVKAGIAVLAAAGLTVALSACGHHAPAAKPQPRRVRICVQPVYSLPTMNRKYRDLAQRLEEKTGYRIEMVSSLSYGNYLSTLTGARVEAGFMNPLTYVITRKTRGAYPLAKALDTRGRARYRGVVVVRGDSGLRTCQDLRGRTIAIVSRRAAAGYLAVRAKCLAQGTDPEKDATILMARTQDGAVKQVYRGRAAAAFVREGALAATQDQVDVSALRVLAYSDYLPTWCFAAFRDTDPEVAETLREALLSLDRSDKKDGEALSKAGLVGFAAAQDSDYDVVRKMAQQLDVPY